MKTIIQTEEAVMTLIAIYLLSRYNLELPVWIWVLLFFSPDLSMIGYIFNPKIGAYCYNLIHHRGIALALAAIGFFFTTNVLIAIGILLFAHSSFDRMLGFGLKYNDDFKHTHLDWAGSDDKN